MEIITTNEALKAACTRLSTAGFVTVDTEFMRDSTFWPILCLIQLAGPEDEIIIDPLAPDIDLAPFYALMKNRKVVKVFHAARQDIEIFYHEGDAIPDPLFDTQVAAMVCGFGDSVGYETLVRRLTGGSVDKSSRFTDWSRRPLSEKQLQYAMADVTYLRTIYEVLAKRLTQTKRSHWVAEEMAVLQDPETYAMRPENAWKRLKMRFRGRRGLAVMVEIAAWREREAQTRDVPRQRVLKDDALMDIVQRGPRSVEALAELRSVPNGFERSRNGAEVLAAIERAAALDPKTLPRLERERGRPTNAAVLDLLKVLLKAVADAERVAPKIIASTDDLEAIASDDLAQVPALQGWRRSVFGEKALALKDGSLSLRIQRGRVVVG